MATHRRIDWPRVAERLAASLPRERLHPRVLAWADADARGRRPWAIGCSGGADSVALLLLVWAHWPARRSRLRVLHFDHRLRGRAGAADARFCAAVARALGVACAVGRWRDAPRDPSEAAARAARMQFFQEQMRAQRARALWLGHQQDDVAETLLMRLARGSGTAGLAAPRPVQRLPGDHVRLRPLLTVSKTALGEALRGAGGSWREDATNAGDAFFRNRLRASVLPRWIEAAGRDAVAGAALARERLEEDDDALERWVDELAPLAADGTLDLHVLAGKPVAVWRRALHRWLLRHPHGSDLSRQGFDQLLAVARAGATVRFSLGRSGFARVRSGRMHFQRGPGP